MAHLDSSVPPLAPPLRLLDQVREGVRARLRYLNYRLRTAQACSRRARTSVRFHGLRHPRGMGQAEVEAFLCWLSAKRQMSVSTHRRALSALLFLYLQVFGQVLLWMQTIRGPLPKAVPAGSAVVR